jgi:hypothetical protein
MRSKAVSYACCRCISLIVFRIFMAWPKRTPISFKISDCRTTQTSISGRDKKCPSGSIPSVHEAGPVPRRAQQTGPPRPPMRPPGSEWQPKAHEKDRSKRAHSAESNGRISPYQEAGNARVASLGPSGGAAKRIDSRIRASCNECVMAAEHKERIRRTKEQARTSIAYRLT